MLGLEVCVMVMLGMTGPEQYLGDKGVLGGVGGWEGECEASGRRGGWPRVRFSRIFPETKQTVSLFEAIPPPHTVPANSRT